MSLRLKNLAILGLITLTFSCSNKIINPSSFSTTEQLELGTIGVSKNYAFEKNYDQMAIPKYKNPVKVSVKKEIFNKSKFEDFKIATSQIDRKVNIVYIDSLEVKPNYLKIEIADRVSVIDAINSKANLASKEFLKIKYQGHLVSEISIVFPQQLQKEILAADEVFINSHGIKSYALNLYKESILINTIPFSEGVLFNYGSSNFCWKNVSSSQWDIADIVPSNKTCPKGTYRSPKKEESLNQYLRF